jgi:2-oxoglutarate ferredoxin oxidoreductase subunit gamma
MTEEIIIAGFGGQGVLSMGKILAYSGIMQDQEVSWMPSYGPEMRGGTANVMVIISDEIISSPIINRFDTAIILNQQSLDKFEGSVKPGGVLIYDGNGILRHPQRTDISIFRVDAAEEAARMKSTKIFNMIVLGGYLKVKPIVAFENVVKGLAESLPQRHHALIPLNEKAIKRGMEIVNTVHLAESPAAT